MPASLHPHMQAAVAVSDAGQTQARDPFRCRSLARYAEHKVTVFFGAACECYELFLKVVGRWRREAPAVVTAVEVDRCPVVDTYSHPTVQGG